MQDSILNETGNSRFLRTEASALQKYPTYQAFMQALMAGEVLIDLNGINPDGFAQVGTPLNKSNLLTDATAAQAGLGSEATPNAEPFPIGQRETCTHRNPVLHRRADHGTDEDQLP